MRALFYSLAYLIPAAAALGAGLGSYWTWLTPFAFFVCLPILDEIVPKRLDNLEAEGEAGELANPIYNFLVRAWYPTHAGVVVFALYRVSQVDMSALELIGILLSVGIAGGAGINVAHELMHRNNKLDRGLAEGITALVSYTHFCVEHVYGHHKRVATPHDPATSRLGETVYTFLPRSIIGGFKSFWAIETGLVARRRLKRFSLHDRRFRYLAGLAVQYALVSAVFGWLAFVFFVMQGVVAFCLLEVVNYLEHYGLERDELANGRYGRVEPAHSWSSPHRLTGWILFGLPRHADHHARAARHYPVLRHFETAPQLPLGYSGMILVALVPWLWRAVMDPKVAAIRAGETVDGLAA